MVGSRTRLTLKAAAPTGAVAPSACIAAVLSRHVGQYTLVTSPYPRGPTQPSVFAACLLGVNSYEHFVA